MQLKDIDRELAKVLLESVQKREFNVTYKEVAERLSIRMDRSINPHFNLATPLGNVSILCFELGLPLISAIVRYSGTVDARKVGDGFYSLACDLKPSYKGMDSAEAWKRELNLVRGCQKWDTLRDYLDGVPSNYLPSKKDNRSGITNPFTEWLNQNTTLAENSVMKYSSAIDTISREMHQHGAISKPLQNMNPFELDIAISEIMRHDFFHQKNTRGNHMYSNALKQYRYFLHATNEEQEPPKCVHEIQQNTTIPETERTALIQSRIGQGIFRAALLDKFKGSCIITGINHPRLLVASHIKPWAVSTNSERLSVDNGLLLSATYDRLFDCGLITFDKMGRLYTSPSIGSENIKRLHLEKGMTFDLGINRSMGTYLEYHNDVIFMK